MDEAAKATLSKVPEVTLVFWIIKIAATTLGETAGNSVTMTLNLGYTQTPVKSEYCPCQTGRFGFYRTDDTLWIFGQQIAARADRVGAERVGGTPFGPARERAGVAGRWDELRGDCEGSIAGRRHHPYLVSPI